MSGIDQEMAPYESEGELKKQYKEAKERRNQVEIRKCRDALVSFYIYYGETYKRSDRPDPRSAKRCLLEAIKLQKDHPVSNYRYAHLMYADEDFPLAAYYFKHAIDGSHEHSLDDTQLLIANIITVNCGLLMAREAIREVIEMDTKRNDSADYDKREDYLNRMLVDNEEMLAQHMYIKMTPLGKEHISVEQYEMEKEIKDDLVVRIFVSQNERILVYRGVKPHALSQTEFYVAHTILMSATYLETKDIGDALEDLDNVIKPEAIRKCLSRLSSNIPFWELVVDGNLSGNYSARRRRNGVQYVLLCHSSVVVPGR